MFLAVYLYDFDQFASWYSQFNVYFRTIRDDSCSDQYALYRQRKAKEIFLPSSLVNDTILFGHFRPLLNCMLENAPEYIKGDVTGGQVLMGFMPSVLALISASNEEVAMLAIVGRRPFLSLLLILGAPISYFKRPHTFTDTVEILKHLRGTQRVLRQKSLFTVIIISAIEYAAALIIGANVIHCSIELATKAVSSIDSGRNLLLPVLWLVFSIWVQLLGIHAFQLRVRGSRTTMSDNANGRPLEMKQCASVRQFINYVGQQLLSYIRAEFTPSAATELDLRVLTYPESPITLFFTWLQATLAVVGLAAGTLIYSSMLFVGTINAMAIISRFIASALVCRVILRYELAGLREACISLTNVSNDLSISSDLPRFQTTSTNENHG
ncbi:hypothetical protein HJFPF1_10226 [Paramyrothecium foliicola]|nr:hypothetical protein HJFPF1_10226 [Paramyrothecium foliicola]